MRGDVSCIRQPQRNYRATDRQTWSLAALGNETDWWLLALPTDKCVWRPVLSVQMSPGALVSFMLYQQSLSSAFSMMGDVFSALTAAVGAADKVRILRTLYEWQ